jgi:signal transduction histidine kinase
VTGRIAAWFLAVLFLVTVAVVLPLGVLDTHRLRAEFRAGAYTAARALAAVSEEHLDDRIGVAELPKVLARYVAHGDGVTVLNRTHKPVAHLGASVANADDRLVIRVPVGPSTDPHGTIVLSRPESGVEQRVSALWLVLGGAAVVTLLAGALVGRYLGRWIATPLRSLITAAEGIGAGSVTARADADAGPPQVREVASAFNEMADRVSALLAAQAAMTADVSHQLRTPLAALRLRLDLLADEVNDELRPEVAGMISETTRLSRLVDGLLAVARADGAVAAPRPVDVSSVCAERIGSWEPLAAERGIALELNDGRQCLARSTPGHLEQILDNLLANALDALQPGGTVRIDAEPQADAAVVRVVDDGPGMTADMRAHAFDRFVTDRRGDGGTGLGLAIVGRLVAADHGRAELRETDGGGLTVEVQLPVARDS